MADNIGQAVTIGQRLCGENGGISALRSEVVLKAGATAIWPTLTRLKSKPT